MRSRTTPRRGASEGRRSLSVPQILQTVRDNFSAPRDQTAAHRVSHSRALHAAPQAGLEGSAPREWADTSISAPDAFQEETWRIRGESGLWEARGQLEAEVRLACSLARAPPGSSLPYIRDHHPYLPGQLVDRRRCLA